MSHFPESALRRLAPPLQAVPQPRTDYTLLHAEHLALAAERLLEAIGTDGALRDRLDDPEHEVKDSEVDRVTELMSERMSGVRSAIYEFRKRRDRIAAPVAVVTIGDTALGNGMRFTHLTDAGRALPAGVYDLYTGAPR